MRARTWVTILLFLIVLAAVIAFALWDYAPGAPVPPAASATATRPPALPSASSTAPASTTATASITATAVSTATAASTATAVPTATAIPTATTLPEPFACGPDPHIAEMVAGLDAAAWMGWIERLSGAQPVTIGGEESRITTRYTPAMFGPDGESPQPNARAFEYVLETLRGWYPAEQIAVHEFTAESRGGETLHGKNLILTLPGAVDPAEAVLLTAHLDSTSNIDPAETAPGAEDNGSGSAALLEAARIFRGQSFERTVQIIWFTGEEQGLLGSRAYLADLPDPAAIAGVINLDMFGYDSNDDGCFELHVGRLETSDAVGQCFAAAASAFAPEIEAFDYLTAGAIGASDHGSFWEYGVGAVEVLENMFDNNLPQGCADGDMNPAYHSPEDTVDGINPQTGIAIVRAALAAAAAMAGPLEGAEGP